MAQQTQVARVVPAYQRFLAAFPTPAACAAAPLAAILRAWAGLGYNRRAKHLHRAAIAVVDRHGGQVPGTLDDLLGLPGVGPYTARAVLAFAFGADVGVVDTNAGRVLSRAVAGRSVTTAEAQRLVDAMVPDGRGWSFGQALLDLGAAVCVAGERRAISPGSPPVPVVGHRAERTRPGPWLGGGVDRRRARSPDPIARVEAGWWRRCGTGTWPRTRSRRPWDGPKTGPGRLGSSTGCYATGWSSVTKPESSGSPDRLCAGAQGGTRPAPPAGTPITASSCPPAAGDRTPGCRGRC